MIAVDTNVLVYASDPQAGDRHERAIAMIERVAVSGRGILLFQTLAEFLTVAVRKMKVRPSAAHALIEGWTGVFSVAVAAPEDLGKAARAVEVHGLSAWDALLWAAADRIGVSVLLTEDFQDGRTLGRTTFVNPFAAANDGLVDELLAR